MLFLSFQFLLEVLFIMFCYFCSVFAASFSRIAVATPGGATCRISISATSHNCVAAALVIPICQLL